MINSLADQKKGKSALYKLKSQRNFTVLFCGQVFSGKSSAKTPKQLVLSSKMETKSHGGFHRTPHTDYWQGNLLFWQ